MKLKLLVAGVLAAASFGAMAGDKEITAIADGNTYTFDAEVGDGILSGGHDLISLLGLGAGSYNIGITVSGQYLNFSGATSNLNGTTGVAVDFKNLSFYGVDYSGAGPFTLDLAGTTFADAANYSGTYSVSAVPEPETYGMLLGGLGLLGFISRRRAAKKAA